MSGYSVDQSVIERIRQTARRVFRLWDQGLCPGGQVQVRLKGQIVYDQCFGYANLEHQVKIGPDTAFHAASVSKQTTVLCALLLARQGKLDIDQDIRRYIGDLVGFEEPVSVRDMMNNVSGIRDQWELLMMQGVRIDDVITMADSKRVIANQAALNFPPQSRYLYSNSNFTLLAEIIQRVSGRTFPQIAREMIFEPLGMDHTCIRESFRQIVPGAAYSYADNGQGDFSYHPLNYAAYGATSMNITAGDLMKLLDHYRNPALCPAETIELMKTRPVLADGQPSPYGAGLMLGDYKGRPYLEHGGSDAAFRAHMMQFYQDDLDVAILANTQNTNVSWAARQLACAALGLPEDQAPEDLLQPAPQRDPAGLYWRREEPGISLLELCRRADGALTLGREENAPALRHIEGNCWQVGYLEEYLYIEEEALTRRTAAGVGRLTRANLSPQPEERLLDCEGRYQSDELETYYDVIEDQGRLRRRHFRHGEIPLIPIGRDCYALWLGGWPVSLAFLRGSGARAIGMTLSGGRALDVGFSKE